jgi:PAS domain S-box-containing protein
MNASENFESSRIFSPGVLVAALILATVGICSTIYFGWSVASNMSDIRRHDIDNRTWVFAQLEVDYFRFENSVSNALNDAQISQNEERNILRNFDIYYSRVDTVHARRDLFDLSGVAGEEISDAIDEIVVHTDELSGLIGSFESLGTVEAFSLVDQAKKIIPVLRDVTVGALMLLTQQHQENRLLEAEVVKQFIGLSVFQILILSVFVFISARLAFTIHARAIALKQAGESFWNIIEASLDGVVIFSQSGQILGHNSAALRIFGGNDKAIAGKSLGMVSLPRHLKKIYLSNPSEFLENASAIIGPRKRKRLHLHDFDGRSIKTEVAIARHEDDLGKVTFVTFIRDLSETVGYENALKKARDQAVEAASAKSRFLNMMSHDMKTPLHGVIAALDLVHTDKMNDSDIESLDVAREAASAALFQVEDVLAISGQQSSVIGAIPPQPFGPAGIVRLIIRQARLKAIGKSLLVDCVFEDSLNNLEILGQKEAFRRAVTNLVDNAVKFTDSGTVLVSLSYRKAGQQDSRLSVTVSDTGPGIAIHLQKNVFSDFTTAAQTSTSSNVGHGLGLGIVNSAVARLGGTLTLNSKLGEGTSFSFEFPAPICGRKEKSLNSGDKAGRGISHSSGRKKKKVLVVDDHQPNRFVILKMLHRLGYLVDCAEDGFEAVELTRLHSYDFILMDIQMPGLNGLETSLRIRAEGRSGNAVILGVTANSGLFSQKEYLAAGISEILEKPLTSNQLSAKLDAISDTMQPCAVVQLEDHPINRIITSETENLKTFANSVSKEQMASWMDDCLNEFRNALAAVQDSASGSATAVHQAAGIAAFIGAADLHRSFCELENHLRDEEPGPVMNSIKEITSILAVLQR